MKIKNIDKDFWNIIKNKGKLISHRLWTISIELPNEYLKWAYIKEFSYLYGKEFYTQKIYEDRKGVYREEILKYTKKEQYQCYIRGLRRNIKKTYHTVYIVEEEFLESEESAI